MNLLSESFRRKVLLLQLFSGKVFIPKEMFFSGRILSLVCISSLANRMELLRHGDLIYLHKDARFLGLTRKMGIGWDEASMGKRVFSATQFAKGRTAPVEMTGLGWVWENKQRQRQKQIPYGDDN